MHPVGLEPTKLILIGTRTTYQVTGDAGSMTPPKKHAGCVPLFCITGCDGVPCFQRPDVSHATTTASFFCRDLPAPVLSTVCVLVPNHGCQHQSQARLVGGAQRQALALMLCCAHKKCTKRLLIVYVQYRGVGVLVMG